MTDRWEAPDGEQLTAVQDVTRSERSNDPWAGLIAVTVTVTCCLLVLHWAGVI